MALSSEQLTHDLAALKIDREEPPRRGIVKPFIYLVVVGTICAAAWLLGYPYVKSRVFKTEVTVTEVGIISPAQAQVELAATGYVQALTSGKVAAKVVGRVSELPIKEGDVVKKGAVIARLEDSVARSQVTIARARTQAARARVATARAQLAETTLQAAREKALAERGVSAKAGYEDLAARSRSLSEGVRAAEAEAAASEAEVAGLEVALADMTVTSPIDGIIVAKHAEFGELVGPMTNLPIVDVIDFTSLIVEIDVPEAKLRLVKQGAPGEIVLDAYPDRRYRGQVLELGRRVDRAKASVKIKVSFVDPAEGALPDMAARVNFLAKELDAASMKEPPKVVVAAGAIIDYDGGKALYVVDQGKLHLTKVQVGDKLGDSYVLTGGPIPGTKVVANPTSDLREGQAIKEKND